MALFFLLDRDRDLWLELPVLTSDEIDGEAKGTGTMIWLRKEVGEHYVPHESRDELVAIRVRDNRLSADAMGEL